ncbi:MAG TPA: VOC family protein [Thermomicrobiales bacterium]|nr:VOC family protein [Thermomicrobiales bacterium]
MSIPLKTSLLFRGNALEVMRFYETVFPDFEEISVSRMPAGGPDEEGEVMAVNYKLLGMEFVAINADFPYVHDDAVSFMITVQTQDEIDTYWTALLADGGEESMCGWLKDRFGISWQVIPVQLPDLLGDPDPGRAGRAMQAMLQMRKIDLAAMQSAADSRP